MILCTWTPSQGSPGGPTTSVRLGQELLTIQCPSSTQSNQGWRKLILVAAAFTYPQSISTKSWGWCLRETPGSMMMSVTSTFLLMTTRSYPLLSSSMETTGFRLSPKTTCIATRALIGHVSPKLTPRQTSFSAALSSGDTTRYTTTLRCGSASHLTMKAQSVPLKRTPPIQFLFLSQLGRFRKIRSILKQAALTSSTMCL